MEVDPEFAFGWCGGVESRVCHCEGVQEGGVDQGFVFGWCGVGCIQCLSLGGWAGGMNPGFVLGRVCRRGESKVCP